MTNRVVALSVPLLVFIAIVVAVGVATIEPGLPQIARSELDRYVTYRQGLTGIAPAVRQIVPASLPSRFTAELSAASYGDSPYYRTTSDYRKPVDTTETDAGAGRMHFFSESGRPLPFPPERLWCVILDPGDLEARRLVYVALHQDLYNADWIVHEGAAGVSDAHLKATLSRLGCA